jgi:ubiquinone/menaquinone biosynthesis C-methylase UbiE
MDIRRACENFYWKAQKILVPSLKYSQTIYEEFLLSYSSKVGRWLDLGCGHQLLPPWRLDQEHSLAAKPHLLIGLDYDYKSLRNHKTIKHLIQGDISSLPFASETFDLITANMVFEHLNDPQKQLSEIFRILKPGGSLVFHTPNSMSYGTFLAKAIPETLKLKMIWFLQHRKEEDVFPTYYRFNTEKGIRKLAERVGFKIGALRLIVSSAQFVMIPPLVIFELLLIRLLMMPFARCFRTNIIACLIKPKKNLYTNRLGLSNSDVR